MGFSALPEILDDLRQGRMVVLVDDENRENEGDLVCAAEKVTPEIINFMTRFGRGVLCLALTADRCDELDLSLQVEQQRSAALHGTAFTISIDAAPKFRSYRGYDYVLWPGSPCIDSGTGEDDGIPWNRVHPTYGRYNLPAPDMGTYGGPFNLGWRP